MAHDVLISYSSKDKLQADAICNRLESKGIRCWIAPRDVPLGTEYAESIVEAIEETKVMVLVFSANADKSHQVRREVERAVSKGVTIVPVRIEDAEMSKSIELYVSSMHWLDAITPPLEQHIDKLAEDLSVLISEEAEAPATPPTAPVPASPPAPAAPAPVAPPASATAPAGTSGLSGTKLALGGAVLAIILLLVWIATRPGDESAPQPGDTIGESVESSEPATGDEAFLTFVNDSAIPVDVFWLDWEGQEEFYQTVEPGQVFTQETFASHRWVVRTAEDLGSMEIQVCEADRPEGECVIDLVTGWDVALAEFETPEGEYQGAFRQSGPGSWVEEGADGEVRFRFQETDRDSWSVYMHDASRAVDIQIDLWTREIRYADADNPQFVLAEITGVSN